MQAHAFETGKQNNGGAADPSSALRAGDQNTERRRGQDRRKTFDRKELLEMRQARRILFSGASRWALVLAVLFALLGWGIGWIIGPASERLSPGWTRPGALVSLLLGAICGALGGAATRVLYELFHEDQDMPVVVIGVATFVALGAGIHGAGQGGILATLAGIAGGTLAGIASGFVVYLLYSVLRVLSIWVRKEFKGY